MVKEHYTVTHTMADGTKRDSIAGYVIPDDNPIIPVIAPTQAAIIFNISMLSKIHLIISVPHFY